MNNFTYDRISEFILVGFPGFQDKQSKAIISIIFLIVYIAILIENIFIIVLIIVEEKLHKPMYYFICNLAISGIFMGTVLIPKMLVNFLLNWNTIDFGSCMTQAGLYSSLFAVQMYFLSAMSYDRVLAVCRPLHYNSIMTPHLLIIIMVICWVLPLILHFTVIFFALQLSFCGPNVLPSCHCNHSSIITLSCTNSSANNVLGLAVVFTNLTAYSVIFVVSYGKILLSVLKIKSPGGHRKAFMTCGAHLCILSMTLFTSAFVYICARIKSFSDDARLVGMMVQNLLCPLMNPIIYALMTKEIKTSIHKIFCKNKTRPLFG
uniref:G-protein coupled receptors family 1 profile domain-containing protein n=1 Tax=Erpetoichthys calabaricus TaxID=27687 RepID=A0A8C4RS04_ERPCA